MGSVISPNTIAIGGLLTACQCGSGTLHFVWCRLVQDLSKVKLWQKGSSSKTAVTAGPISISRSLPDPVTCPLEEWAPMGGPVRPLLQVGWPC